MQILILGEDKVKSALASEFSALTVGEDDGGLGVTSYISENQLVWTRVIGAEEAGMWDVFDNDTGACAIVKLEQWEERIITS